MIRWPGGKRLFLTASKGALHVLDNRQKALPFSPIRLQQTLAAQPVVGDLDGDGDLEFISADSKEIIALDLPDSIASFRGWRTLMGNNRRTGYLKVGTATAIADAHRPAVPDRMQINTAPNPFNASVRITLHLPRRGDLRVRIYDINGRRVKTLFDHGARAGMYRWIWRGRNETGKIVSSGLYFVTIQLDDHRYGKQILFVK